MPTFDENAAGEPIVFISYSQGLESHSALVRTFADRLKTFGIDVRLDQYNPDPPDGWPLWMERGVEDANYVLLICTETYLRRLQKKEAPGVGLGVRYEGDLIRNLIYSEETPSSKFVPVLLEGGIPKHIPTPLLGRTRYEIKFFGLEDPKFAALVAKVTGRDLAALVEADETPATNGLACWTSVW